MDAVAVTVAGAAAAAEAPRPRASVPAPPMPPSGPVLGRLFSLEVAPSRRARLDDLPELAVVQLARYLRAAEVGTLARTSRALHVACANESVWHALFTRDFCSGAASPTAAVAKPDLFSNLAALMDLRASQAAMWTDAGARLARLRRARCRRALDCFEAGTAGTTNPALAILFLLLLGLRLDGHLGNVSYFVVFAPAFLLLLLLLLQLLALCLAAHHRNDPLTSHSLWADQHAAHTRSVCAPGAFLAEASVGIFQNPSVSSSGVRRLAALWVLLLVPILLVLQPVLIAAKLEWPDSASWGTSLTPLWIALAWVPCVVSPVLELLKESSSYHEFGATLGGASCCASLLLLTVLVPLVTRFDNGGDYSLFLPFIPVFAFLFIICGGMGLMIFILVMDGAGEDEAMRFVRLSMGFTCTLIVCTILFITFLSLRDAQDLPDSFGAVYVVLPLFFIILGIAYGCYVVRGVLLTERERSTSPWKDFYAIRGWEASSEERVALGLRLGSFSAAATAATAAAP